jgi:tetratricopeptide (TPR) repeat protein
MYDKPLAQSLHGLEAYSLKLARERDQAPALFEELVEHSAAQRNLMVCHDIRFRTWGFFELLVERSHGIATRDFILAEELGLLALRLSEVLDPDIYTSELIEDLRGRAWACVGNARRVRSDLRGADEAFEKADACLRRGSQDLFEQAIFCDLKSSLRRNQNLLEEALRLAHRALTIFRKLGQQNRVRSLLVKISTIHHRAGSIEQAIPFLYQAMGLIDPQQEPRLMLCIWHNLADDLAEVGRFSEALNLFRSTRQLYRAFPELHVQNQRKWVRAKIARGLGQYRWAELLFKSARNGLLVEGIPYDIGLISMDLAILYAHQGRVVDINRLALEMVVIFSGLRIHRETLAALILLRRTMDAWLSAPC